MTNGTLGQDMREKAPLADAAPVDVAAEAAPAPRTVGPLRRVLKLIVEIDSSRFASSRLKAGLMLFGLLALFAGLGYGLPALFSRYFR